MTDFYLDLCKKETFESLKGVPPFEYSEGGIVGSFGWDVDIIGDAQMKVVSWDSDGTPKMEPVGGFLVNLRSSRQLPESLTGYLVFPKTPIRVWA